MACGIPNPQMKQEVIEFSDGGKQQGHRTEHRLRII